MMADEGSTTRRTAVWDVITHESSERDRRAAVRDILRQVPLFTSLDNRHLEEMAQISQTAEYGPNEVLVREGDEGHALVVLAKGTARVERHGQVIAHMGPGDHLGEIALVDGHPRTATVLTDTPATVVVLSKSAFDHMMQTSPEIKDVLLLALCSRLRELQSTILG
jgi:CRP-like cAMP-binding protein